MPASGFDSRLGSDSDNINGTAAAATRRQEKTRSEQSRELRRRGFQNLVDLAAAVPGASADDDYKSLSRTHSAPSTKATFRAPGAHTSRSLQQLRVDNQERARRTTRQQLPRRDHQSHGQDEDELAGVVGARQRYQPLEGLKNSGRLPEINIAVVGGERVGKSTLIRKSFDVAQPSHIVQRKLQYGDKQLFVRLLELSIDDVHVDDDDDTLDWPETIQNKLMPKIHGMLVLYDVQERNSFAGVRETLAAASKASLPCVLVATKCDTAIGNRELDPLAIELQVRQTFRRIETLQISPLHPESHKKGISMILKAVVSPTTANDNRRTQRDNVNKSRSNSRVRARSNILRPASPKHPSHTRASSENSAILPNDSKETINHKSSSNHERHDSSLAEAMAHGYGDRPAVLGAVAPAGKDKYGSFLLEESGSDSSQHDTEPAVAVETPKSDQAIPGAAPSPRMPGENGVTFDYLVDRLLAPPLSKSEEKFEAMFLALYREFAAPGRLLEAIVDRFDTLEHPSGSSLAQSTAQSRCITMLATWIAAYPGDFAHPKTKRRTRTFIAKIGKRPIFGADARQMANDLDNVQEDDDTYWACSDRDREAQRNSTLWKETMRSTASLLIDDPNFQFPDGLKSEAGEKSFASTLGVSHAHSNSDSSVSTETLTTNIVAAQRQAQLLRPIPRQLLTKIHWRTLYELPDDAIARELTRIDWLLFLAIRPRDLVRHVMLSTEEKTQCKNLVNVTRMIDHFNRLALWVSNFILLREKPKHRALMLEKFMKVARKVRELNNYNSLGAIIAGVRSTCVNRLAATRELVPPQVGKDWTRLEMLMGPQKSHSPYRLAWENSYDERIPYLPLHLRDLTTSLRGNKTYIGSAPSERINWKKFEVVGEVILLIQSVRENPYKNIGGSRGNETVKELLLEVNICTDEDKLFERSAQIEPTGSTGKRRFNRFQGILSAIGGEE